MKLRAVAVVLLSLCPTIASAAPVDITSADYRDRVFACWLGKSIGGTLGMPFEGRREIHHLTFFEPVPTKPLPNDDLDLQLLWLKALEERGPRVDAGVLGEYWLSYVPVDWNEYGVGKANLRLGFAPPVSGQFRNQQWRDSNGAWIRSEIWACLAPGRPALAARYAFEDACVDHGVAEGTWAELFCAALESAAFVESNRDRLLAIGLAYIPADCAVAKSVRAAMAAKQQGLELAAAREAVIQASKSTGWFMAPQNVAFTVLGWLYGEDDFGRSLCAAVNCGDDTDCTGATLGSLLGILRGTKGIPERWRKPVGEKILTVAVSGFRTPRDISELTDRTVAMAHRVLAEYPPADTAPLVDEAAAKGLWARSPWQLRRELVSVTAVLDLKEEPLVAEGQARTVAVALTAGTPREQRVTLTWRLPAELRAEPASQQVVVKPGQPTTVNVALTALGRGVHRGTLEIAPAARAEVGVLPFALATKVTVRRDDLALASRGATATSDSELERERGCTARLIDGAIAESHDFEGRRWHSALTPHPHWVQITLPEAQAVGGVVLHFADRLGYPVSFVGEGSLDGQTWAPLFDERNWRDPAGYEKRFTAQPMRYFRLTIRKSASAQYPHAAQLSELELLP